VRVTKSKKVLLSISQATSSPLLTSVISAILETKTPLFVVVTAPQDSPLLKDIEQLGVPHINLKPVDKYNLYKHFLDHVLVFLKFRPNVFLASGQYATYSGIPAAFLLGIPKRGYIRHHSNFHHVFKSRAGLFADTVMNKLSTRIIAVSGLVYKILTDQEKVPKDKVVVIHNGIDLSEFSRKASRNKRVVGENNDLRIGVVSRLTKLKGVEFIAEAYNQFSVLYPKSSLHIIGEFADSYGDVMEILSRNNLQNFSIERNTPNMPDFLSSIDVFVHVPIAAEIESFGLVYLEALATKLQCIFTKSGIIHELPNLEKYIHEVPYQDSKSIFQKLIRIASHEETKMDIPSDWLSNFSLEKVGESYVKEILS
jgi:glycosyltransferase involved in cell wall biosynthesis